MARGDPSPEEQEKSWGGDWGELSLWVKSTTNSLPGRARVARRWWHGQDASAGREILLSTDWGAGSPPATTT